MTLREQFSDQEWQTVLTGPLRAGQAVIVASPSGLTGLVAEAAAIARAIRELPGTHANTPLLQALSEEYRQPKPPTGERERESQARNLDEVKARTLEDVRRALWLVDTKASPEDGAAYRELVLKVAGDVAQAAKEGGFLGIGGVQVSDAERAMLDELRQLTHREG